MKTSVLFATMAMVLVWVVFSTNTSSAELLCSSPLKLKSEDYQLSAEAYNKGRNSPQQARLKVTLRNHSKEQIIVTDTGESERNNLIMLEDKKGKKLSLSEQGERIVSKIRPLLKVVYVKLPPGEEISEEINLSKLYNLGAKQEYTVKVKRIIYLKNRDTYETLEAKAIKIKT